MTLTLRAGLLAGLALALPITASAEPVTLDEAVRRAIAASPAIQAQEAGIRSARAGRSQADIRPNPVLLVEAENIAGTGAYDVYRQAETTVTYAQTIERGGKRDARIAYAERDVGVAEASARLVRLDLAEAVQRTFIDLQIAEEVVWLAERRLETERAMQTEALRRVRGYKDPLFVETRAEARVARARLALDEARSRRNAARARLASFWGGKPEDVEVPRGIEKPDDHLNQLAAADSALASATVERAQAAVVVEQTRGVQDYTVSGGVRHLRETGDVALVAGISIPLGRFDRNRGNIERAQAERQRIELLAEAARLDRLRQLASLRAEADAARMRADGIMQDVYPKAVRTLQQVREGYNRGGFRFSDVQDGADAIIEVQSQWVEAMTRYRDILSQIDRLTGRFDVVAGEEVQ
ncbi:TolC family protein [Sphingorhabdus buctiana]|jgi:cobalt-zinc-cadmium efflux system outer membrane protein|uniref:TolC family protein n=1 Tax=Sphingorhabdus buctiana TaxID=1508805 RepID=A0ABW4MEI1_9SPHN|nr:TolC family protein [Porphyrobacter sp. LM 6]AOL95476.1 outer membrane protein, cobalt-zinc-cadmium efflux system [Porphyrobacter sp. LM 6]MCZ8352057.1 TolC family protein [Rhizobium sp.]